MRGLNSGFFCDVFGFFVFYDSAALSQSVEFADDFSVNTIRYSVDLHSEDGAMSSVEAERGGIRMSSMTDNDQLVNARLNINERTNSLVISGRFDPPSVNLADGYTQIAVEATLSNNIAADDRPDPDSDVGDVFIGINSAVFDDNSTNLFVCLGRNGPGGFMNSAG